MMVKRKKYFQNPISRQNFANAFAETPNLNLEVRLKEVAIKVCSKELIIKEKKNEVINLIKVKNHCFDKTLYNC